MSGEQSTASGNSSRHASPLLRGKACGNCRRRKIKCDAATPTCAACIRYNRPGDPSCSYYTPSAPSTGSTATSSASEPGPSRSGSRNRVRDLEDEILRLQKRVKELEEEDNDIVRLVNPYPHRAEDTEQDSSGLSLYLYGPRFRTQAGYYAMSPRIHTMYAISFADYSPADLEFSLSVQVFMEHAHKIDYFFLNTDRILAEIIASQCQSSLFHSICLWGSKLSERNDDSESEQNTHLERALSTVYHMPSSSSTDGSSMRHRIQALILLCLYQFHQGNLIEARTLLMSAQSLVQSAGYHQLPPFDSENTSLPYEEYAEKVSAFWAVYSLCNVWSVVLGNIPLNCGLDTNTGSDYDGHTRISTAWPVESNAYDPLYPDPNNSSTQTDSTVLNFLSSPPDPTQTMTEQEMLAKASILFERTNLTKRSPPSTAQADLLNTHLDVLVASVPPSLAFTHLLIHASTIQLAFQSEKHLFSAKSAAQLVISSSPEAGLIDPAIGYLAHSVARVLVDHIVNFNAAQPANTVASSELVQLLANLLDALDERWAVHSNVIKYYASQIRDMYITLLH